MFTLVVAHTAYAQVERGPIKEPSDSDSVLAPEILFQTSAAFSHEAILTETEGSVLLSVLVDEEGAVKGIRILRSLGLGLDQNAIEAVRSWRFRPASRNGVKVSAY